MHKAHILSPTSAPVQSRLIRSSGFRRRKDADSGTEVTLKESRLARPAKKAPTDAFVAALSETEADLTKTLIALRSTAATKIKLSETE